jgi:hypothetical protein
MAEKRLMSAYTKAEQNYKNITEEVQLCLK